LVTAWRFSGVCGAKILNSGSLTVIDGKKKGMTIDKRKKVGKVMFNPLELYCTVLPIGEIKILRRFF